MIRLIDVLRTHELYAHLVASGKAEAESQRAAAEAEVDEQVKQVLAVDRRLGGVLHFDAESLAARDRSGARRRRTSSATGRR